MFKIIPFPSLEIRLPSDIILGTEDPSGSVLGADSHTYNKMVEHRDTRSQGGAVPRPEATRESGPPRRAGVVLITAIAWSCLCY